MSYDQLDALDMPRIQYEAELAAQKETGMNRPHWTYDTADRVYRARAVFHNATVELIDRPNENRPAVWNWEVATNRGMDSEVIASGEAGTADDAAQAAETAMVVVTHA